MIFELWLVMGTSIGVKPLLLNHNSKLITHNSPYLPRLTLLAVFQEEQMGDIAGGVLHEGDLGIFLLKEEISI